MRFQPLILTLIILLAIMLRFANFELRYGIGYDGSRDAIVSFESKRQLQLPLTGSFSSIGPITFGPWYYYYLTLANLIIPSMWAPWISIGMASVLLVVVMYNIGVLLISKKFGLILAFLTSVSPAQLDAATALQQHNLIGFLTGMIIFLAIRHVLTFQTDKTSLVWGFATGLAINSHYQAAGLLILPIIVFFLINRRKFILFFIIGLFISMIPLLIFETNNHWFNSRNMIDYFLYGQYRIWVSNRWLTFIFKYFPEFWREVMGTPFYLNLFLMILTLVIFLNQIIRKRLSRSWLMIILSFLILVFILRYWRGEKFFGYLQFFHPYLYIFTGYCLYIISLYLKRNSIIFLIMLGYLLSMFGVLNKSLKNDEFNIVSSNRLKTITETYQDKKIATFECIKVYDRDRIQGVALLAYMNKLYDDKGFKMAIYNPSCSYYGGRKLENDLVDVSMLTQNQLEDGGFKQLTIEYIYTDTARWWFKEQP